MKYNQMFFKKSDLILLFALLAFALAVYFLYNFSHMGQARLLCEILVDGQTRMTVDLGQEKIFSLEDMPNVVFEVNSNRIAFQSSDCPDKICVRNGYLKQAGQTAACLPNHIAIRIIQNASPDAPDVVI